VRLVDSAAVKLRRRRVEPVGARLLGHTLELVDNSLDMRKAVDRGILQAYGLRSHVHVTSCAVMRLVAGWINQTGVVRSRSSRPWASIRVACGGAVAPRTVGFDEIESDRAFSFVSA
jgi:hypothetical protein